MLWYNRVGAPIERLQNRKPFLETFYLSLVLGALMWLRARRDKPKTGGLNHTLLFSVVRNTWLFRMAGRAGLTARMLLSLVLLNRGTRGGILYQVYFSLDVRTYSGIPHGAAEVSLLPHYYVLLT